MWARQCVECGVIDAREAFDSEDEAAAGSGWDKTPPAPAIPVEVVERTRARYVEAYERLTGEPIGAYLRRMGV